MRKEMPDEKEKLLQEIAALKNKVDELEKKLYFLDAVQEHYAKESAYFSSVEAKIRDLFITVSDRRDLISSVDYALQLYQHESSEEKEN